MSIHSVWLGNNITPLREEEWGEDEEDEADTPAPTSPPLSPINSRSVKLIHFLSQIQELKQVTKTVNLTHQEASRWCRHPLMFPVPPGALQPVAHPWLPEQQEDTNHPHQWSGPIGKLWWAWSWHYLLFSGCPNSSHPPSCCCFL